jgi:segregation and condensation protein B
MEISLPQILEALIFASPKPLPTAELVAALRGAGESSETDSAQQFAQATELQVLDALAQLDAALEQNGRAFRLLEQANGWGFVTRPEYAPWVRQLYPEAKPARLSGPALETLAIIAYRQPVTRADIEAVRGVAVDGVMQVLLDRSLVRITGRAEQPGRPLLYSTTDYFLEHFGLKSTSELPNAAELGKMPLPTAPPPEEKGGRKKDRKTEEAQAAAEPELPFGDAPEPVPVESAAAAEGPSTEASDLVFPAGDVQGSAALPDEPAAETFEDASAFPETGAPSESIPAEQEPETP